MIPKILNIILLTVSILRQINYKQECIPVGCIPSVAVAVGGVSARGLPAGGVCLGGCLPRRVSAPVHAEMHIPSPCEQNDRRL